MAAGDPQLTAGEKARATVIQPVLTAGFADRQIAETVKDREGLSLF